MEHVTARLGTGTLQVAIARTSAELARGFRGRDALDENEAMLFDPGADSLVAFTLRATAVPLDVAFLDARMRIVQLASAVPAWRAQLVAPVRRYRYALETPARWCVRHGAGVGSELVLL